MEIVKCKLVESIKRPGKWKVWVKDRTGSGWFYGEKAYASRLNAERAIARRFASEKVAYEFIS